MVSWSKTLSKHMCYSIWKLQISCHLDFKIYGSIGVNKPKYHKADASCKVAYSNKGFIGLVMLRHGTVSFGGFYTSYQGYCTFILKRTLSLTATRWNSRFAVIYRKCMNKEPQK